MKYDEINDCDLKTSQGESRRTAPDSPKSAARFVRGSASSIRASSQGISQYRAEYLSLIEWARNHGCLIPFTHIERFDFVGEGAEHRVYKDNKDEKLAIKATLPNKFGYSTTAEGQWATPIEYLKRLAWQNRIFGDDIRIVGVAYEDDQMEVVTSQPWISAHEIRPNPFKEEIDVYMGEFSFISTSFDLDTPMYYSPAWKLIAADAHDRNIIRDCNEMLSAIDLVIGPPSPNMRIKIDEFFNGPLLPF